MELRNYILHSPVNLVDCVIDEVSLEGLDGITLEALWQRMAIRLQEELPLSESLKEQIWSICSKVKGFSFHELRKSREPLVIFDRFELLNNEEFKKSEIPKDIYPHFPIDDLRKGIRGSCASYNTRIDITLDAKYFALEDLISHYGERFVIVASQILRERALVTDTACPIIEMNLLQYCFLERVGRARFHGDVSHGQGGLGIISDDPKSMFYHRKFLLKQKLITKQAYAERVSGNSYRSSLLHLTRFYVERRPKFIILIETIINYLKAKENYIAAYDEVKEKLQLKTPLRKIFKTPLLKSIIKTDLKVPYGNLYPNSAELQKHGVSFSEKIVRAVKLIDPNIDINQFWGKHDNIEEEESYDLDTSKQKLNVPYLKQANRFVEEGRQQGVSQTELGARIGMTKLHTRTILRNLAKTKIVATYMKDIGKQRVTKYLSKRFEHSSEISKQLEQEMDKMKEFNRTSQEEINDSLPLNVSMETPSDVTYPMHEEVLVTDEVQNHEVQRNEVLFATVNRILSKYKTLRSRPYFKYTYLGLSQLHATSFWDPSQGRFVDLATQVNEVPDNELHIPIHIDNNAFKDVQTRLVSSKPQNIMKRKTQVTGFLENMRSRNKKNVTYRLLKRANLVIEAVKHNKVIEDTSKLLKLIKEEEDKEGYDVKIDKKSLARLLQRLAKDNLIKYIKLTLSDHERQKIITFICDPSIDKEHSLIQSAVEQAKIRFCLLRAPVVRTSKRNTSTRKQKLNTQSTVDGETLEFTNVSLFLDPKIGKKYGYSPKFLRMKALHNLLFYLVYEHPGHLQITKEDQVAKLRSQGISFDDDLVEKVNEIFTNEVSWKMFIPPLPKHPGWCDGWALMCDVLIRLPLSIFVKVYNIPFVIPDLESYLEHPIKRHFLVKDISPYLRNVLLKSRKYIFVIHETITRLCYLGLLQFGPQKLKEKDQIFVFVNHRGELMETTSSGVGYHKIEKKAYPVLKYEFKTLSDVEKYWYDMWEICINTNLGGRLAVQGKDILLEDLPKKDEMIKAAKPRVPDEVFANDTGKIPGDHQGAAGLDSALFSHLKRNWTWSGVNYSYQEYKPRSRKQMQDSFDKSLEYAIEKTAIESAKTKKDVRYRREGKEKIKTKADPPPKEVKPMCKTAKGEKKGAYVRTVLPRKKTVRNRVKYDEVDYRALQRMDKLRVDWEPHEDNILLMCKVAMMYLFPNPRKQFVTFIAVRDTLRAYSTCSHNKTSRACQRRLLYMLKQPQTVSSVMLGIEEIKQNYFVNKRFNGLVDRIKSECHNPIEYEEKVAKIFKDLVAYISKKYYDISNMEPKDPIQMPQTVHMFNLLYDLRHPSKTLRPKGFTKDVKNTNDIHVAMINTVIHSSMCSGKDKKSWTYQLFKIYQQYSESNLRVAMAKIRSDQMVSMRKSNSTTFQKSGNCMPMSNAQYQLSLSYYYKFQTKWPYNVFFESYNLLYKMIQWQCENQSPELNFTVPPGSKGTKVLPITGGIVAGIHDFFAKGQLDFEIEMPDQIIMLDPRLQEKDEVYLKIAKRYQSLLINYTFAPESGPYQGPEIFEMENLKEVNVEDERQEEVSQPDVMQRPLIKKGTIEDNYTIENVNTVFLEEPQITWSQGEGSKVVDIERVNVRSIKRCLESEDEDAEPVEKRSRLEIEDERVNPIVKRFRANFKKEDDSDVEETFTKIQTGRQYYANNLKKAQTLLKSMKEPSQSLQKAVALEEMHLESNLNSINDSKEKRTEREILAQDPLNVDNESDPGEDLVSKPPRVRSTEFYTRLGMLKLRNEYNDLTVADSHHAHDFFVVNSFNIFYKLSLPEVEGPRRLDVHRGYEIPSDILPLKLDAVNKLINKIKKNATIPKNSTSYQALRKIVIENTNIKWDLVNEVWMFIKEKKDLGASLLELSTTFHKFGEILCKILSILTEHGQVLRSGVTTVRYIHQQHFDPWLIHSYKIPRLEQESQIPLPKGSVYMLEDNSSQKVDPEITIKSEPNNPNEDTETLNMDEILNQDGNNEALDDISGQLDTSENGGNDVLRRSFRKKNAILKDTDVFRSAKMLDLNSAEEMKVVIKPWIHVDGTLNRRVLDRMMGAVLSYCIKHPGVMLNKVQNRFLPALQPFHTRELVETLVELGCLNVKVLKLPRVSLFSAPIKLEFSGIPNLAQEEEIVIEPENGATLRFGTYLSNKTYTSDFLS